MVCATFRNDVVNGHTDQTEFAQFLKVCHLAQKTSLHGILPTIRWILGISYLYLYVRNRLALPALVCLHTQMNFLDFQSVAADDASRNR